MRKNSFILLVILFSQNLILAAPPPPETGKFVQELILVDPKSDNCLQLQSYCHFSSKSLDKRQPHYGRYSLPLEPYSDFISINWMNHDLWTSYYMRHVLGLDISSLLTPLNSNNRDEVLDFLIKDGFIPLVEYFSNGSRSAFDAYGNLVTRSFSGSPELFTRNMVWQDNSKLKPLLNEYKKIEEKLKALEDVEYEYSQTGQKKHWRCRYNNYYIGKKKPRDSYLRKVKQVYCSGNLAETLPGIINMLEELYAMEEWTKGWRAYESEREAEKAEIEKDIQDERDKYQLIIQLSNELKSKNELVKRKEKLLRDIKRAKIESGRIPEEGKYCIDLNRNKTAPESAPEPLLKKPEGMQRSGYYGQPTPTGFVESDFKFWFCADNDEWMKYIYNYLENERPSYLNTPLYYQETKDGRAADDYIVSADLANSDEDLVLIPLAKSDLFNDWIFRVKDGSKKYEDRISRTLDYFDDYDSFNVLRVMYDEILSPSNLNNGSYLFSDHIRDFSSYDQVINRRQSQSYYQLINWLFRDQQKYNRYSNKLKAICTQTFNEEIISFGERIKEIFPGIDPCKPEDVFKAAFHFFSLSNLYKDPIPSYEDTIFVLNLLPNIKNTQRKQISSKTFTFIDYENTNPGYDKRPEYKFWHSGETIRSIAPDHWQTRLNKIEFGSWSGGPFDYERDSAPVHIMELNIWTFIDIVRVARGGELPHISRNYISNNLWQLSHAYLFSPRIQSEAAIRQRISWWHLSEALIDGFLQILNPGVVGLRSDYSRDGRIIIREVSPDSSAMDSGEIKEGDVIFGVAENEEDTMVTFNSESSFYSESLFSTRKEGYLPILIEKAKGKIGTSFLLAIENNEGKKIVSLERRPYQKNTRIKKLINYYEDLITNPIAGQNGLIGNKVNIMLDPQKYKDVDYENYKSLANKYYLIKQCYEDRSSYAVKYITRDEFNRATNFFRNQTSQLDISSSSRSQIDADAISYAETLIFPASKWGKERSDYCALQYSTFMNKNFWSNIIDFGQGGKNDGSRKTFDTINY